MARNGEHVARQRIRFRQEPRRPLAANAAHCARDMPSPKAARVNPDERSSDEDQRPPTWADDEETGRDAASAASVTFNRGSRNQRKRVRSAANADADPPSLLPTMRTPPLRHDPDGVIAR
jgi:hypothetical protein